MKFYHHFTVMKCKLLSKFFGDTKKKKSNRIGVARKGFADVKRASFEAGKNAWSAAYSIGKEVKLAADIWINIGLPKNIRFRHEYA